MPIRLGPKTRFGVCFLSCLGWQWISYKVGSLPVVDKYQGYTFICTTRASGRGIIMDTGSTDLSSEQTYIVANYLISPFTEIMSLRIQMKKQNHQGSSLCWIYTLEPSLCLSIQDSVTAFQITFFCFKHWKECYFLSFFSKNGGQPMMIHSYFPYNIAMSSMNFCSKLW